LLLVALSILFIPVLRWGTSGFFLAQIVSGACSSIAALWMLRHVIHPRFARLPRLREMLRFALPFVPAALALWVMAFSDRLFLKHFLDLREVGLYDAAARLATIVAAVTGAFTTAWGPFALSMQRQPEAPAIYARALLLYLAVGGAMVAMLALFAPEAFFVLATPAYFGAAPVVGILCLGVLAYGATTIAGTGLALAKKSAPVSFAVSIAAAASIGLNFALIPLFGKTGSAWASGISWAIYAAVLFFRAQKIYPLPYDFRRALLAAILLVGIVVVAPRVRFEPSLTEVFIKLAAGAIFVCALFSVTLPGWPGMLRRALRPAV